MKFVLYQALLCCLFTLLEITRSDDTGSKPRQGKNLSNVFPFNLNPTLHRGRAREGSLAATSEEIKVGTSSAALREEIPGVRNTELADSLATFLASRKDNTKNDSRRILELANGNGASLSSVIQNRLPKQRGFPNQRRQQQQQQQVGVESESVDLSIGNIAAAGERCVDKVEMVEETEYDEFVECLHSYSERCHTTYTTDFQAQQEEECEENFRKNCFIEYRKVAQEEEVQFCYTPFICEGEGPEECKVVFQSQCETRYHEHAVRDDIADCEIVNEQQCEDVTQGYTTEQRCTVWPRQVCQTRSEDVLKYSPETECRKVPQQLCGPSGCIPEPGEEECFPRKETIVVEVPEETCNLEPQRACRQVTKLVPSLKPTEECVDVPKEVCSRSRRNPRRVQKPVVKRWCYVPTPESGLF